MNVSQKNEDVLPLSVSLPRTTHDYVTPPPQRGPSSLSGHIYISVHGSCLTYFINLQQYLPTTQKKGIKESIAMMPGLVRISNRVFWVSGYNE